MQLQMLLPTSIESRNRHCACVLCECPVLLLRPGHNSQYHSRFYAPSQVRADVLVGADAWPRPREPHAGPPEQLQQPQQRPPAAGVSPRLTLIRSTTIKDFVKYARLRPDFFFVETIFLQLDVLLTGAQPLVRVESGDRVGERAASGS